MLTNGVQETLQFDVLCTPSGQSTKVLVSGVYTHLKGEQPSGKYEKYIVVG